MQKSIQRIKDFNVRPKTLKLLEENKENTLQCKRRQGLSVKDSPGPRNNGKNKETEMKGWAAKEMAVWTQPAARRKSLPAIQSDKGLGSEIHEGLKKESLQNKVIQSTSRPFSKQKCKQSISI